MITDTAHTIMSHDSHEAIHNLDMSTRPAHHINPQMTAYTYDEPAWLTTAADELQCASDHHSESDNDDQLKPIKYSTPIRDTNIDENQSSLVPQMTLINQKYRGVGSLVSADHRGAESGSMVSTCCKSGSMVSTITSSVQTVQTELMTKLDHSTDHEVITTDKQSSGI